MDGREGAQCTESGPVPHGAWRRLGFDEVSAACIAQDLESCLAKRVQSADATINNREATSILRSLDGRSQCSRRMSRDAREFPNY